MVRATGGLRDTVFDVDCDKARAAWEMEGSSDWERDGLDATNGFSFEVRFWPAWICLTLSVIPATARQLLGSDDKAGKGDGGLAWLCGQRLLCHSSLAMYIDSLV